MPRCKHCKDTFTPLHFNQKFCFKDGCRGFWIETEKAKQWVKRKKEIKRDMETVQDLMKKAQKVFNEYIRLRDKDKPCISCGKKLGVKYDAGHYVSSGSCKALTFDERNVNAQCVTCNQHKHGNLIGYREGLLKRYDEFWVDNLESRRKETAHYTREELRHLMNYYKEAIKELTNN